MHKEIAPGVYSLWQKEGGRVHAFMVDDGPGLTLIDALYDSDANGIFDLLKAIGRVPTDIKRILITHGHKSHLGGLATISAWSGAPVYAHELEAPIIDGRKTAAPVSNKFHGSPLKWANWEVYDLQVGLILGRGKHDPACVHERLTEGMRVGPFQVIHVPGHTPGCVAFYWEERKLVIAGDTVATWPELDRGWPAFNLDPAAAKKSVAKMAELKPDIVCVGHGDPILTDGADILHELAI